MFVHNVALPRLKIPVRDTVQTVWKALSETTLAANRLRTNVKINSDNNALFPNLFAPNAYYARQIVNLPALC